VVILLDGEVAFAINPSFSLDFKIPRGPVKRVLAVQRFFEEGCPEFPAF
jgi:hypothetical protein